MESGPTIFGGRYRLKVRLGQGAYAEVFQAWDDQLNRLVAIKMFTPHGVASLNERQLRDFRRELEVATTIKHPAIAMVYSADRMHDRRGFYMVMEYVPGKDLATVLTTEGPLPFKHALELMAQICSAAAYLHSKKIIHRDIKPANIIVSTAGGKVSAKLIDLGLAKILESTRCTKTATGLMVGTPSYMSPEQCLGLKLDCRSDVFALGTVLYECLTGTRAFYGDNSVDAAYRCLHEDPPSLRDAPLPVPPCVEAMVLKALSKDPDSRYQTVAEMQRDIDSVLCALLNDRPLPTFAMPTPSEFAASPFTLAKPVAGQARVSKKFLSLAYIGIFILLGAVGYAHWSDFSSKPSTAPAIAELSKMDVPDNLDEQTKQMLSQLDEMKSAAPDHPDDYVEYAVALAQRMRWYRRQDLASIVLADCRPSSSKRGQDLEKYLFATRGELLADQGHYSEAIDQLRNVFTYMNSSVATMKGPYLLAVADCYEHLDERDKAVGFYKAALAEFEQAKSPCLMTIVIGLARSLTGQREGTSERLSACYNEIVRAEFTRLMGSDRPAARRLIEAYRDQPQLQETVQSLHQRQWLLQHAFDALKARGS